MHLIKQYPPPQAGMHEILAQFATFCPRRSRGLNGANCAKIECIPDCEGGYCYYIISKYNLFSLIKKFSLYFGIWMRDRAYEKFGRRNRRQGPSILQSEYDHMPTYVAQTVWNTRAQYTLRYQNFIYLSNARTTWWWIRSGQLKQCNNLKNKFTCEH